MKSIVEVWHGAIPTDSRPLAPSVYCRISEAPFGIPCGLYITHHLSIDPTLVVHVYGNGA